MIKKVEIWGPQKELILRAKVPTPQPSRNTDVQLLTVTRPNHPDPEFTLPTCNEKSQSACASSYSQRPYDGMDGTKKRSTETENAEYGSAHQNIEVLDPLENNVMNTGAVFGKFKLTSTQRMQ